MDDDDSTSMSGNRGPSVTQGSKFVKTSKEFKLLKSWFTSGKIKPTDKPSDIKARHQSFAKFNSSQFRSQYNKLKKELLVSRDGKCAWNNYFLSLND